MERAERFNAITHLVGTALALVGLIALVVAAGLRRDAWRIASACVYGGSLLLLYTCSTLYHGLRGRAKRIFQRLDHTAIYLLIAGTYTPFALVALRGPTGWRLFGAVWALAVLGALQECRRVRGERILSLVIYMAMGWLAVAAIGPLRTALGPAGFAWLLAGGLFYTGGVAFYVCDRRRPACHGIWHLFVLAGSAAHYVAVLGCIG